ncbi:MAG: twin-arginine translocase subunit TatC [Chloroflexi bacterium]|nr:twin-arginine translocase subunit TatC [Chloroflexota bacterium]
MAIAKDSFMAQDVELTIFEHLAELRSRLFKAALALLIGTLISIIFTTQVLELLIKPLAHPPQVISPTEHFFVYFQVALICGVTLAMPVIVYQIVRFMLPGLLPQERKYLYFLLPGVAFCFTAGVAFAALIMLPAAINFMQGFLSTVVEANWTLGNYVSFVTRILFWMGMVFQTPLLMFFLTKLGLISPKKLSAFRKYAIVLVAVIAALVTPTPDPVNMAIVMVPLYLLYEVGIILSRLAYLGHKEPDAETTAS